MIKFTVKNRWTGVVQFTAEIDCHETTPRSIKLGLAAQWAVGNDANLIGADLSDANLIGAKLIRADLSDADLSDAKLAHAKLIGANLSGAKLTDADLTGAKLAHAKLIRADLSGAKLIRADLSGAKLTDAKLIRAKLIRADLSDANLTGAKLAHAKLIRADLSDANLTGAKLTGAKLAHAKLSGANIRQYKADLWMILSMAKSEVPFLIDAVNNGEVDGSTYKDACACLIGTLNKARNKDLKPLPQDESSPAEQWFSMIQKGDKPGDNTGGGFASKKVLEWIEEWAFYNDN